MKTLIFFILVSLSSTFAVTYDDATVENHMDLGWPAVNGKGWLSMTSGFWHQIMTVTECKSGKKYFEQNLGHNKYNILETSVSNSGKPVFRYFASQVFPYNTNGRAYYFSIMDNAQSFQSYVASLYKDKRGITYLGLAKPSSVDNPDRDCVSLQVWKPY